MTVRGALFFTGAGAAAALALLAGTPERARAGFPDAPPPAHTGGFGEPTCRACHFDGELNEEGGGLTLGGVPAAYRPGERYRITVTLRRGEMKRGGFELAARFTEGAAPGRQAGSLRAVDERVRVTEGTRSGVQYATQARPGVQLTEAGRIEWVVEWTAPAAAAGPVVFHAAANAANGDESQFGDLVYTATQTARAP
ncbi:MAG: choice-of-anchor V domain-containing protein [Longimicrobiaceae bacterium]